MEKLEDGPGLLPFKLGATRLTTHYHTFLQYVELGNIKENINTVQTQLIDIRNKLDNYTYALYEIQLTHLTHKLDSALLQLKTLEPNRFKRGLINGLGSVIKSITGNLDYADAERYNNAISILQKNQDELVTEHNNYMSLSKAWMKEHTDVISKIVENQQHINESIHILLDENVHSQYTLLKFAKLAQLLAIVNDNVDSLVSELSRLENNIAFCSAMRTHHSLISIDVLGKMIDRLKIYYNADSLIDLEFREYYNIIRPASYFNKDQIVFAFKFPIVSPLTYTLYKLVTLPNKHRQIIIPPSPLLAITSNVHVYIEAECPKLSSMYLCEEELHHQVKDQPDCICNVIEGHVNSSACEMTTVDMKRPAMEKLDDRHYAIVFPQPTHVKLTCARDEHRTLTGSFVATIPHNCNLHTADFTIVNANDQIKGQYVKISDIPDRKIERPTSTPTKVNAIDLRKLHSIQDQENHVTPIQQGESGVLYHTTIPVYGIIFAAAVLAGIIFVRQRSQQPKPTTTTETTTSPQHEYAVPDPSHSQKISPATFFPPLQK